MSPVRIRSSISNHPQMAMAAISPCATNEYVTASETS